MREEAVARDLVLVGGGHAHVQVIRRWIARPLAGVRLTLVVDRLRAVYSGMVPGFVAGDYRATDLEIDLLPLARRARARVIPFAATRVDPECRLVHLDGRPSLPYDVASLDVGSTVRGWELPGVRQHVLSTRPIGAFVEELEARLESAAAARLGAALRVALVGGGAAGAELAFALDARLRARGWPARLGILCNSPGLLPGAPRRLVAAVEREAATRGIVVRCGVRVAAVEPNGLLVSRVAAGGPLGRGVPDIDPGAGGGERRVGCDMVVWATGAAPPRLLTRSDLPRDPAGFVLVSRTLQVEGHASLFAAGDCATLAEHPWVPKAGVYAVRQGPVLDANLRAQLGGGRLRAYHPQRDFLALLNLGGRRALGAKWGIAVQGRVVWRLKDAIDRRFVSRFQVLAEDGAPSPRFPSPKDMDEDEMACGGCAAKLEPASLARALARLPAAPADPSVVLGLEHRDDAAAFETPGGDVVVASVDGFRAFTDDPWLVGRVAAVNAASDVFAKGAWARHALALVTLPDPRSERAEETLAQVLAGVRAALDPLGATLVGGHTTVGPELFVALAITGVLAPDERPLPLSGARPGDALILSKALGTGVVLAADRRGAVPTAWFEATVASMLRPNAHAMGVARRVGARACTDVSGFGLAGHLAELLRDGASAVLDGGALPVLPGAASLLARGIRSSFHEANADSARVLLAPTAAHPRLPLLFDPQTSGGLLFAVPAERAEQAVAGLRAAGDTAAAVIGAVEAPRADAARIALG